MKITESTKVTLQIEATFTPNGETTYQVGGYNVPSGFAPDKDMVADMFKNATELIFGEPSQIDTQLG